jgi:hypothetical protein
MHNLIIVLSIISIALMLTFLNSDIPTFRQIAPKHWVGFLFFPVGVIAGMLLGWWREALGGAVTVGSLLGFYLIYGWFLNNQIWLGVWFIIFALPGILFLISGLTFRHFFYRNEPENVSPNAT